MIAVTYRKGLTSNAEFSTLTPTGAANYLGNEQPEFHVVDTIPAFLGHYWHDVCAASVIRSAVWRIDSSWTERLARVAGSDGGRTLHGQGIPAELECGLEHRLEGARPRPRPLLASYLG